jgi:2-dehydro-3-deoxygluconokinase
VDRANSAASQLKPGDFDWSQIFSENKVKWLHTGGVFASLSDATAELVIEACKAAKQARVTVSYDMNFRASLWQNRGGYEAAQKLHRRIAPHVDAMFGALAESEPWGGKILGESKDIFAIESGSMEQRITKMRSEFPNIRIAATTLRRVHNASRNDWSGLAWIDGAFHRARNYENLDILDRIGGGDGFVAGLVYGVLSGQTPQLTVELAAAHGALAMTTPGDNSIATLREVMELAAGGDASVRR